jgi:two-component system, chemotaxis family, chemotaxis protein CheY
MPSIPTTPTNSHKVANAAKRLRTVRVLVVDDDRRIAKLICSVLEGLGFENLHVEHSAETAMTYLRAKEVDMVICDWMMDGQNGVDMVRELRRDLENPNQLVPVIMLSGNSERPQVEDARDAGVTEYVMKPFTAKSLCSRIISVIDQPRSFIMAPEFSGHNRRRKRLDVEDERRRPR